MSGDAFCVLGLRYPVCRGRGRRRHLVCRGSRACPRLTGHGLGLGHLPMSLLMFHQLRRHYEPSECETPEKPNTTSSLEGLQSDGQRCVLRNVAQLRKCDLESILSLPQLVVCGDQWAGKGSAFRRASALNMIRFKLVWLCAPLAPAAPAEPQHKSRASGLNLVTATLGHRTYE